MRILTELMIRGILVVGLNDAVIFYWMYKHSQQMTLILALEIIGITCVILVINIWYCLYRRGLI